VPVAGYSAALISLLLIYQLAATRGVLSVMSLLLTGVVFNAFSFALILVINALANFGQAHQILYLMLGSVEAVSWDRIILFAGFFLVAFMILWMRSRALNLLALGDEEAFHLGVNVRREKIIVFILTSLLVGVSVSLCGLIGFVGLFVPHLVRLFWGADNRVVLPVSALVGGLFLVMSDFLASHVISFQALHTKLPVGAVTALIGAPLFVFLLKKQMVGQK
jgi:iron complex transport system permease protein